MEGGEIRTVRVSDKGQISIPNNLRQKIGINRGDNLLILEFGGKILLEKSKKVSEKIKEDFQDLLEISENSLEEIWNNQEDKIWDKYLNEN